MNHDKLIYAPQPNATPDEVMEVLKVFTIVTLPDHLKSHAMLMEIYKSLPINAQRHFKIVPKKD